MTVLLLDEEPEGSSRRLEEVSMDVPVSTAIVKAPEISAPVSAPKAEVESVPCAPSGTQEEKVDFAFVDGFMSTFK